MRQAAAGRARLAILAAAMVAAGVLAATLLQGSDAGAKPAAPKWKQAAGQRLLRLGDLGPGHFFLVYPTEGSDRRPPKIICGRPNPGDQEPKLKEFLDRKSMRGCFTTYVRVFPFGDSPAYHVVGAAVADAGSPTLATAGLAVTPQLLSHLFSDELPEKAAAPGTVGDESRLFHVADFPIFGDEHPNASVLAWRSGDLLAVIFVQGGTVEANDSEALELARLQQQRIENPTPYTRAERYDAEAGLEDPAIEVPIYWLGRTLRPGDSLLPARLDGGGAVGTLVDGLPHQKLGVYYDQDVELATWTAAGWQRFSSTKVARELLHRHCTSETEVPFSGGSATVYAASRPGLKRCHSSPPTHHYAIAEIGGIVLTVNLNSCPRCSNTFSGDSSAYNSTGGMEAILAALRPWPKPAPP